jgi:hypothetical protein
MLPYAPAAAAARHSPRHGATIDPARLKEVLRADARPIHLIGAEAEWLWHSVYCRKVSKTMLWGRNENEDHIGASTS